MRSLGDAEVCEQGGPPLARRPAEVETWRQLGRLGKDQWGKRHIVSVDSASSTYEN
jgi:hypothetical protein